VIPAAAGVMVDEHSGITYLPVLPKYDINSKIKKTIKEEKLFVNLLCCKLHINTKVPKV